MLSRSMRSVYTRMGHEAAPAVNRLGRRAFSQVEGFCPRQRRDRMKTIVKAAVTTLLCAFALGAAAQTPAPGSGSRIDKRQAEQQQGIDEGLQSGQINEKEKARLEKGQARIQKMEDKARADGTVTKGEAARINKAQD